MMLSLMILELKGYLLNNDGGQYILEMNNIF